MNKSGNDHITILRVIIVQTAHMPGGSVNTMVIAVTIVNKAIGLVKNARASSMDIHRAADTTRDRRRDSNCNSIMYSTPRRPGAS